jgi:hypothetical protein
MLRKSFGLVFIRIRVKARQPLPVAIKISHGKHVKLHEEEVFIIKSFCGVQGRFFQKEPLAAGGKIGIF